MSVKSNTMLIAQCYYMYKIFSNCMLEHRRRYFRPRDRGHSDCDLKLRCADLHEDIIMQLKIKNKNKVLAMSLVSQD